MPELAEVEWYRKQWDAGRGHQIVNVRLHPGKYVFRGTDERFIRRSLPGKRLLNSERHGKQMLFRFSDNHFLGIHLGMTGRTHVESAGFKPGKYDHLVLHQRGRALVFSDPRQLGRVRFHAGTTPPEWWQNRPPEIASPQFDQRSFNQFLARHEKAPIKAVLLMQTGFAGIGNWMADEILWRAGVLPSKRVQRLTSAESAAIFRAAKFVVKGSLQTLGRNFSDPPRGWLIHQKWKRNGICPRHGVELRHGTIGGRTAAWCPRCQR